MRLGRPLFRLLVILCVFYTACTDANVKQIGRRVDVAPAEIAFPATYVGFESRQAVQVSNSGLSPVRVKFFVGAPFAVVTELELGPGETSVAEVSFSPVIDGFVQDTLRVEFDEDSRFVRVEARGEYPSACNSSTACLLATFDPQTGSCDERPVVDGTRCSEPCLVSGRCSDGRCVGASPDCSDNDACTRDLCDPSSSCVHLDEAARCPPVSDPCLVAYCDPRSGCSSRPASDGTSCGVSDCVKSRVCLAGACRQVPTPEGAVCAPATPCKAKWRCRSAHCVEGADFELREAWSYSVTGDWAIAFPGVTDEANNIYWVEREAKERHVDLVSATRDGVIRYRQRIATNAPGYYFHGTDGLVIRAGDLLILAVAGNYVEARRLSDGGLVWRRDLVELATSGVRTSAESIPPRLWMGSLLHATSDSFYVIFDGKYASWGCPRAELCDAWVMRLAAGDGRLIWSRSTRMSLTGSAAVDSRGSLYYLESWDQTVVRLDSDGSERWRVFDPRFGSIRMMHSDRLLLDPDLNSTLDWELNPVESACKSIALETSTGAEAFSVPTFMGPFSSPSPVAGGGTFYAAVGPVDWLHCPFGEPRLISFDAAGHVLWERLLTSTGRGSASQPVLTDQGYLIAIVDEEPTGGFIRPRLVEISRSGDVVFSCPFPLGKVHRGSVALAGGRWFSTESFRAGSPDVLRAYEVPMAEPARSGWVTQGADMRKSGQDQQEDQ